MEIPVTIISTKELYGIYHSNEKCDTVIITVHGLYGSRVESHRLTVFLARELLRYNIGCLRIDMTGSGISRGEFIECTFQQQFVDINSAISWIKQNTSIKNIYLLGISDGAITAYHVGAKNKNIKGMIFWSPVFTNQYYVSEKKVNRLYRIQNKLAWISSGNWLYKDYYNDKEMLIKQIDFNKIGRKNCAVCGTGDNIVYESLKQINSKYLDLYIIEKADHIFSSPKWVRQLIDTTIKWMKNNNKGQ